jgi:hypothetical protein
MEPLVQENAPRQCLLGEHPRSPKIARLHLDRINVQIGDVDIQRAPALRQATRIGVGEP